MKSLRETFSCLFRREKKPDFLQELRDIVSEDQDGSGATAQNIHSKFESFSKLLDNNNKTLKILSDMEEKAQGEYLFDIIYIRSSLDEVRSGLQAIIDNMIALGGYKYAPLKERYREINNKLERLLPENRPIEKDDYTIHYENLGSDRAWSVGSKNAQLGEMKTKIGLPVPEGFAISAWAYKHFVELNDLQARISDRISSVDFKRHEDLVRVSGEIQNMVISSPLPEDLAGAIRESVARLDERSISKKYSLRSSAIGEDTSFSFAGQYATFLNVKEDQVLERYREVLASKFTPKAIYYFLSHDLSESDLAMSVGCVDMVNAAASGVVYTRDPVRPDDGCLLINSVYGLGQYLVDGTLTPDVFRVSREDLSVKESHLSIKPVKLVMSPEGGTTEEAVPDSEQSLASLSESHVKELAEYALRIENHYGGPRDIEWAIDREGRLFLLQSRPLQVFETKSPSSLPDLSSLEVIMSGGTTVCPGAGGGPVHRASSKEDLAAISEGAVLVAPNPFPGLITVMDKVTAIVTEVGGVASHMATIAREYRIPTLFGMQGTGELKNGQTVTVDATEGIIYSDIHKDLIDARRPEYELLEEEAIINLLKGILIHISPLNLLHPADPDFTPQNCSTFHDITRFCHQMSMDEMFSAGKELQGKGQIGLRLKSKIPLPVVIIYLDEDLTLKYKGKKSINEEDVVSEPMNAFWSGVNKQGWPKPPTVNAKGFMSVMATHMIRSDKAEFLESSFAILSREYMIFSLRMGYHFTTVEGMCTSDVSKNYIRMQFKLGGASPDRRIRRIKLIEEIVGRMGFENSSRGDFLDTMITYQGPEAISEKLYILGRLSMMTKQLDMALSNDKVAKWYTEEFIKQLGLDN